MSLVKLSYWSKFHVNIITGYRVMKILFIRDWPQIWKSEIPLIYQRYLHKIWRLRRVRDTTLGTNVSKEMLLNATIAVFTVSQRKTTLGEVKSTPQIRVNHTFMLVSVLFLRDKKKTLTWTGILFFRANLDSQLFFSGK